jgi:hypothetical protein
MFSYPPRPWITTWVLTKEVMTCARVRVTPSGSLDRSDSPRAAVAVAAQSALTTQAQVTAAMHAQAVITFWVAFRWAAGWASAQAARAVAVAALTQPTVASYTTS